MIGNLAMTPEEILAGVTEAQYKMRIYGMPLEKQKSVDINVDNDFNNH